MLTDLYKTLFVVEPLRGLFVVLVFAIIFHLFFKWIGRNRLREYETLTGSALSVTDKSQNETSVTSATTKLQKKKEDLLDEYDDIIKEAKRVLGEVDGIDHQISRVRKLARCFRIALKV